MLNRYWPLLAGGALLIAIVWSLLPDGQKPEPPAIAARPDSPVSSTQPTQPPPASPFLTTHKSTWGLSPTRQNVDSRFHSEIEQLRMSVGADSNDVDALLKLAHFSQDAHQLDEAVSLYRRVVNLNPTNRDAWMDLTRCYGELEEWSSALATVDKMLEHHPEDPGALYNKGAILANLGELDQAREVWTAAAAQDDDPTVRSMAASALTRLNQP